MDRDDITQYVRKHRGILKKPFIPNVVITDFCFALDADEVVGASHTFSSRANPLIEIVNWICVDSEEAKKTIRHELAHCLVSYCFDKKYDTENTQHGNIFLEMMDIVNHEDKLLPCIREEVRQARTIAKQTSKDEIIENINKSIFWRDYYVYEGDSINAELWGDKFDFWNLMLTGKQNSIYEG